VLAISNSKITPLEHDWRERGLDIRSQSLAGDPSNLRAHGLDRGHQRIRQWHRPEHVEAELSSRLGVFRNTARVVIGHAGDKSRTQPCQRVLLEAFPKSMKSLLALRVPASTLG
jgi:hypothetical protein